MEYLGTFFTHCGAIKYARYLQKNGIDAETMPVPRKYSSNCGIGVKFRLDSDINDFISEDIEKLFQISNNEAVLVYCGTE